MGSFASDEAHAGAANAARRLSLPGEALARLIPHQQETITLSERAILRRILAVGHDIRIVRRLGAPLPPSAALANCSPVAGPHGA